MSDTEYKEGTITKINAQPADRNVQTHAMIRFDWQAMNHGHGIGENSVQYKKHSANAPGRTELSELRNISPDSNRFADDDTIIQPMVLNLDATESSNFDPYNTSSLEVSDSDASDIDPSKSWDLHSRYKRTF